MKAQLVAIYKILRWFVLAAFIVVAITALRKPQPPSLPMDPAAAKDELRSFNDKLDSLAGAHARGETGQVRLNSDEVNLAIRDSARQQAGAPSQAADPNAEPASQPAATDAPPAVETVQVGFVDDLATGQFSTELYGKQVYITVSGRLGSKDGYVTFDPTAFKVGDFEVPVAWVNGALQNKLAQPENREKLKLPDYISDLRVENGELVITEK